jgi:hypothetical protein
MVVGDLDGGDLSIDDANAAGGQLHSYSSVGAGAVCWNTMMSRLHCRHINPCKAAWGRWPEPPAGGNGVPADPVRVAPQACVPRP